MKETIDAIYEKGVFRPLKPPTIIDGLKVRLEVETLPEASPDDLPELAAQVYNGLSNEEIDEIQRIALDRGDFFVDKSS